MVDHVSGVGVRPVGPESGKAGQTGPVPAGQAFHDVLAQQIQEQKDLQFSTHAMERIRMRGLPLSVHEMQRLKTGVNQIAEKGGRESVVLMDNTAFIVSVKNHTVITAIGGEQMKNNVFTNIDSAVIV
ncbi:hypothetical protein KAR48_00965 [bacterium]|nr:hypothetical protein [bacterium]